MAAVTEDKRLAKVEAKQDAALKEVESTYKGMAEQVDQQYQSAINQIGVQDENGNWNKGSWADKQTQIQNEQTDLTIEQIEQQKEQAQKDYTKEQSGAYVDYQKQTAQHGANAEAMAANGMAGTGYSESSKVSMYNTYQNRVAAARESYNQVVMNYNNAIKEAQLQNNSALAEIAFNALQKGLELSLQGFQYKNQLVTEKLGMKLDVENMYHGQWMDVLGQINNEKAQAEQIRQFDLQHQLDVEALAQEQANWQKEFDQVQKNWQTEFDYGKEQDALAQGNWQAEFDLTAAQIKQSQKLEAAQVMAAAGDFSGYKDVLGLTSKQVKKLEAKYQEEITSEADAQAYAKEQEKAAIMASAGDFSGYKELYGLTNAQVKKLEEEYEARNGNDGGSGGTVDLNDLVTVLNGGATIDNDSILALGQGPISMDKVADMLVSGEATAKVVGNKVVFQKVEEEDGKLINTLDKYNIPSTTTVAGSKGTNSKSSSKETATQKKSTLNYVRQ